MPDWLPIIIKIVVSIAVFVIAMLLSRITFRLIVRASEKKGSKLKAPNTVKVVINVLFVLIALMIILSFVFEDLVPVITGIGVGGIVIGFALKEPLENTISGIFLLVGKTIHEGDVVSVGDISGVVEVIGLNHTVIKTFDGKKIHVPNKMIWTSPVTDFWPSSIRRLEMVVGMPYGVDVETSLRVLKEVLEEDENVYKGDVSNAVLFNGFSSSSIDFKLLFWFERPNFFAVQNSVSSRIYEKLKQAGISIPFPQLDLHVIDMPEAKVKKDI